MDWDDKMTTNLNFITERIFKDSSLGRLTSPFGERTLFGRKKFHKGIDIGIGIGTPLYAIASGKVVVSKINPGGYGDYIAIYHNNCNFYTLYAHLSKRLKIIGDMVSEGELIGYTGNSGLSTGAHLHFEITKKLFADATYYMDPMEFNLALLI